MIRDSIGCRLRTVLVVVGSVEPGTAYSQLGAPYGELQEQTATFRESLERNLAALDEIILGQPTTEDQIDSVLELAAWAHTH